MPIRRVILITPGFTADTIDCNCLPTLQLYVLELLRLNIDVQVITLDYPFTQEAYQWHGAQLHPCDGRNSRWLKPRTIWRALKIGRALIQDYLKPEAASAEDIVLHSFWLGWASGIGERLAKEYGIRHITTLMGQDVLPQNKHRFRYLTAARQSRLVVLSDFQNEAFKKHSGLQAGHVIPWGVAKAEIPEHTPEIRPIDVLGAGSLIPLKNWAGWLQTIALLAKKRPGIKAVLLGDGPEKSSLTRMITALGLQDNVQLAGDLPRPQVLDMMQQAKVLLHTSNYESQGYVLSEAAMNGCRVVSTAVGIGPLMGPCGSEPGALEILVETALEAPFLGKAFTPFLLSDTAEEYLELYGWVGETR